VLNFHTLDNVLALLLLVCIGFLGGTVPKESNVDGFDGGRVWWLHQVTIEFIVVLWEALHSDFGESKSKQETSGFVQKG